MDYYEILGLDKNTASAEEIRKAYRTKAVRYHPDKNPGDKEAENKFKEISEAYEVLKNPEKKKKYDMFGKASSRGPQASYSTSYSNAWGDFDFSKDMDDVFNFVFRNMGGFSSQGKSSVRPKKGSNIRIYLGLTLEELYTGTEKTIKYERLTTCEVCNGKKGETETCRMCEGHGFSKIGNRNNDMFFNMGGLCPECEGKGVIFKEYCSFCRGKGQTKNKATVKIIISRGTPNETNLLVQGQGNQGFNGGGPGDLFIIIKEIPHPKLVRDGDNLKVNCQISFVEAVLGTKKTLSIFDKKIKLKIKAGTQPGATFLVQNLGMPVAQSSLFGDLIVSVIIKVPTLLVEGELELYEKLKEIEDEKKEAEKSNHIYN